MNNYPNDYILRDSQQKAVTAFTNYLLTTQHTQPAFLWNAVMRWGKCLTSLNFIYQFNHNPEVPESKKIKNALILTFFPATEDSWARLFDGGIEKQEKFKTEFNFVSLKSGNKPQDNKVNVFFGSFQQIYTGTEKKNSIFYNQNYDLVILDEYHFGAHNAKARDSFKQTDSEITEKEFSTAEEVQKKLKYKYKLVLTGTPYKVFNRSDEFGPDKGNTFTFTYFDEQRDRILNPNGDYKNNPQLKLYSVNINKDNATLEDKINFLFKNTEIFGEGKQTEPMFIKKGGASFWLVERVKDADKIQDYIENHYPNTFNIINLYKKPFSNGDTLAEVNKNLAANKDKYSIILSFNKLTLGITIPEVENVVFLRNVSTAELYMQAGCRAKSQYSDKSKKFAYLISFDIDNDFTVFQQVVQDGIDEEEFVKLLPINFINYDVENNQCEIKEITGKTSFLDALAKVPLREMIRKAVSSRIKGNIQISPDILEALDKISGIGNKKSFLTNKEKKEIAECKADPKKAAEKAGVKSGRDDKEDGLIADCPKDKYADPIEQSYFEKGYKKGYNMELREPKTKEEHEQKESDNAAIAKVQLLIERFLYILIGDYYRENRFMDIKDPENAPEEFFDAMLGFDKNLFVRLYTEVIINNDYIDNIVSTFKSRENKCTPYMGLSRESDYEFYDLEEISEDEISKQQKETNTISAIESMLDFMKSIPEEKTDVSKHTQKYIYIATPSTFLLGLLQCFRELKKYVVVGSEMYENTNYYLEYFGSLAKGVKIGETHRTPDARLEELNGYLRGKEHLLFDIYEYLPVPENLSDTEFHKILEEKGYKRIKDDVRRELFDMTKEDAFVLLKEYKNGNKQLDKLTEIELQIIALQKQANELRNKKNDE